MITQERLKQVLLYDDVTGWFTNRLTRNYNAVQGERAGVVKVNGRYRMIGIDGVSYYEHKLAWLYVYGEYPESVDHIDGNGCFNSIFNLRTGTQSQNLANADFPVGISGHRGVYFRYSTRTWYSKIQVDGKEIWLGTFDTKEEASEAFQIASEQFRGEFAFHLRDSCPSHRCG